MGTVIYIYIYRAKRGIQLRDYLFFDSLYWNFFLVLPATPRHATLISLAPSHSHSHFPPTQKLTAKTPPVYVRPYPPSP